MPFKRHELLSNIPEDFGLSIDPLNVYSKKMTGAEKSRKFPYNLHNVGALCKFFETKQRLDLKRTMTLEKNYYFFILKMSERVFKSIDNQRTH